jgi:hypothetical protein
MMNPLFEQLATAAIAGYVVWMLLAGRTLVWGDRDHPDYFFLNTRWVHRDAEAGLYWGSVALHVVLLFAMAYIAFVQ